jgi:hypothetical protein
VVANPEPEGSIAEKAHGVAVNVGVVRAGLVSGEELRELERSRSDRRARSRRDGREVGRGGVL